MGEGESGDPQIPTGVFYFIFDVEDAPVIFTAITCFFVGGIVSEFVQSMLPANLLGSSLGLYIAYHLERYYRHRREISRLYQPLNDDVGLSEDDDDMEGSSMQLLPTHIQNTSSHNAAKATAAKPGGLIRLENVWDEGEELFGIGDDTDDEGDAHVRIPTSKPATPKIVVTDAEEP
ncbi:predicted protein [Postia placenta Mad-698-R]|uniref:Uncharacterized protein n=1 Tax=Postia placenta MAD-698-R-SB12 TaxID=670580 RepID=A0A1X6NBW9_9APHY|nr:hypothetical protein POSPLADRAFT_1043618 [Postia placenta MAD-698-R-SB12]EED85459.1 predicted protein [Postia placenta Mad-698-R]OSX66125.1 hypothetical protein POSPLADRAFT_1043618 [Postia placenta MAD-698-R-SB12]